MESRTALVATLIAGLAVGLAVGYAAFDAGGSYQPTTATTGNTPQAQTYTYTKTVPEEYTVNLAYNEKAGLYLTDAQGRTLYIFAKDYNGTSACYGQCAEHWPPFYTSNLKVAPGLDPNDFGVIERSDGSKQLTYKGWPLYYYVRDKAPGDIKGDGVKDVWFVAKPDYTVLVSVKPGLGMYLVDDRGRTLYVFANDEPGKSNCYGQCAQNWPPFTPARLVVPSTLNLTDFTFIMRDDGTVQLAYKGHPLYYWINDHQRGDTTGHCRSVRLAGRRVSGGLHVLEELRLRGRRVKAPPSLSCPHVSRPACTARHNQEVGSHYRKSWVAIWPREELGPLMRILR